MLVAGIDVGSATAKTVLLDEECTVRGYSIVLVGGLSREAATTSLGLALEKADTPRDQPSYIIGTGYGRERIHFANERLTEITCHARGVHFIFPEVHTIIDIGGQDSKVIILDDSGSVYSFQMNDKCAAGTGRFLEVMANVLQMGLEEMAKLGLESKEHLSISSTCTVFAESEVISHIAEGRSKQDIIRGLNQAIARRVEAMVRQQGLRERAAMTGGVARNIGVVRALEEQLGTSFLISEEPQITGALGAALIALERQGIAGKQRRG